MKVIIDWVIYEQFRDIRDTTLFIAKEPLLNDNVSVEAIEIDIKKKFYYDWFFNSWLFARKGIVKSIDKNFLANIKHVEKLSIWIEHIGIDYLIINDIKNKVKEVKNSDWFISREYLYTSQWDNSIKIIAYIGESKSVEIPTYINGKYVSKIWESAFSNKWLTQLSFEDRRGREEQDILEIEYNAFRWNNIWWELIIPNFVKNIGKMAFAENKIEKISILKWESSLTLWEDCFHSNKELLTINIERVNIIESLFWWCEKINSFTFSNDVETIKKNAFTHIHNKIKNITFQSWLKHVETDAFKYSLFEEIVFLWDNEIQFWDNQNELHFQFFGCDSLKFIKYKGVEYSLEDFSKIKNIKYK